MSRAKSLSTPMSTGIKLSLTDGDPSMMLLFIEAQ